MKPSLTATQAGAKVIIGFASGLRKDGSSPANERLAAIAVELHQGYNIPFILQEQLVDCLPYGLRRQVSLNVRRSMFARKEPNTHEIGERALSLCRYRGWNTALIVAHPDQMVRAVWTTKKLGFSEVFAANTFGVPYDPNSLHWQTRGHWRNIVYEILARLYFYKKGWI